MLQSLYSLVRYLSLGVSLCPILRPLSPPPLPPPVLSSSTTPPAADRGSSSDEADEVGRSPRSANGNSREDTSGGRSRPLHPHGEQEGGQGGEDTPTSCGGGGGGGGAGAAKYAIIYPKKTSLKRRLRVKDEDHLFLDFVAELLLVDPTHRCVCLFT